MRNPTPTIALLLFMASAAMAETKIVVTEGNLSAAAAQSRNGVTSTRLTLGFDLIDRDGDGSATIGEIRHILRQNTLTVSARSGKSSSGGHLQIEQALFDWFRRHDLDKNGLVTRAEAIFPAP